MTNTVVILPTYNESENLKELLPKLKQYDIDILVADASPNGHTKEVAEKLGICVYIHKGKFGRVPTILGGIEATMQDNVVVIDADGQHPADLIPALLKALERSDIAIPSRRVAGGGYEGFSLKRKIVSAVANLLAWPLMPKLKDRTSGAIAFRRSVLNGAKLPHGFSTLTLSILLMGKYNSFEEVPYVFSQRTHGESKLTRHMMLEHLTYIVRLYFYKFRILRFMLVGTLGAVIGLGSLYVLTEFAGLYYLAAYIVAFILSVTNNYICNSLWTFKSNSGAVGWTKYVTICATTLMFNSALMYILTDILGLWYMFSAVVVILLVFLLNYVLSKKFVWKG